MKITRGTIIGTCIGAALAAYIGNRGAEYLPAALKRGDAGNTLLGGFWDHITAAPLAVSTAQVDLITGACLGALVALIVLYNASKTKPTRPGEEQGSAGWGTKRDAAPYGDRDPAHRIQLTATEALSLDTRKTQRNLNALVIGGSGSGKSRHYVIPNASRLDCSLAITDAKGEIRERTQAVLEERGHAVRVFNLVNLNESHGFNALRYVDESAPETSIVQLVDGIVSNTSGADGAGAGVDKFWDRAEKALLTALIAYVWATTADTADHEASLADVSDLHKRMAAGEGDAAQMRSEVDLEMAAAREVVAAWKAEDHSIPQALAGPARDEAERRAEVEARAMRVLDFATRQYRVYEQGPGETKMSIIISLGVRLAPLDMWDVRRIISHDTIALDRIGFEPTALFLELPDTHATFNFLATMFWQAFFEKNIYLADRDPSRSLPLPVHCFLDEFANIGKIPNFERVIATIRSRGISASVVVQTYGQGKALWQDHWPTIVGNCDSVLYLGSRDQETREWISKQLGPETVITEDTSRSYGSNASSTRSQHLVKRDLLTAEEVGRMSDREAILMIRGVRPFRSPKAPALP